MATVRPSPCPLRVLVADDAGDVAAWLSVLLRHAGHEVRAAANGNEAVALAAEFRPQVALLDIGMPGLDGYEVARQIRAMPGGESTVLVATTGWGDAEDKARTREAGFEHHLVKPVPPDRLLALLSEISNKNK